MDGDGEGGKGSEGKDEAHHSLDSVISMTLDPSSGDVQTTHESSSTSNQSVFVQVPINGQVFIIQSKNSLPDPKEFYLHNNHSSFLRPVTSTLEGQTDFPSEQLVEFANNESDSRVYQSQSEAEIKLSASAAVPFQANLDGGFGGGFKTSYTVLPMTISNSVGAPGSSHDSEEQTRGEGVSLSQDAGKDVYSATAEEEGVESEEFSGPRPSSGETRKHAIDHDYLTLPEEEEDPSPEQANSLGSDAIEQLYAIYHPLNVSSPTDQKIGHQPMLILGEAGKLVVVKGGEGISNMRNLLGDSISAEGTSTGGESQGLSSNAILTAETIFRCKKCLQTFPLETIATYHYKTVHLGINDYQCEWCLGIFPGCLRVHLDLCEAKLGASEERSSRISPKRKGDTNKRGISKRRLKRANKLH